MRTEYNKHSKPKITNTLMKMEVPQVDLPLEVLAWTKVTEDIPVSYTHLTLPTNREV